MVIIEVRVLVEGSAKGEVLCLSKPLSLWGGVDVSTGRIVEVRHPQYGETIAGRLLVMPHGRGSSSSSSILAETLRRGCGPVGIVLHSPDSILVAGSMVARELYGSQCPIVVSDIIPESGETWSLTTKGLAKVG